MTMMEGRLHDLVELPASLPAGLAQRAWVAGRRQRRRRVRLAVCAVALVTGVTVGAVVADPALAAPPTTAAAGSANAGHCGTVLIVCPQA